ncbi:MAG TPA: NfeD family protein, partial [Terriglobales bacterium]|nr:NfeD family protein [Terriglobales bacterium]
KVVTGAQGLVGEIGTAHTPLTPQGKVFVHGELWDAVASGNIDAGQAVVVKRIDGLRLEVEAVGSAQISPAPASL